jgi:hypothetical protein
MRHLRIRHRAARFLILALLSSSASGDEPPVRGIPRWRGFNLTDMTRRDSDAPAAFRESDFRTIAAWGFNFVRLPLTYEYWADSRDWSKVVVDALAPIDDAIAWGRKYGLHVCLNFHRAPGYCINPPAERRSLWTDAEAQRACAAHWAFFARRYRDVPNSVLSFNLLNEPPHGLPETNYQHVVELLTRAIRNEDPARLIVVDGLDAGRRPLATLPAADMLQATRGYDPVGLTHFRADWAPGNDRPPTWPPAAAANAYLHGPWKPELWNPLVIEGPFPPGSLRLTVAVVADFASLHVLLDGVLVRDEDFIAAKGGGVSPPVFLAAWDIHQTTYNRAVSVPIPEGTRTVRIEVGNGDWLTLAGVEFVDRHGQRALLALDEDWGRPQPKVSFRNMTLQPEPEESMALLHRQFVEPWRAADTGPVFVGEWGAYNKTPHEITLRWMEDCLRVWQEQGWGWALWNFRGPFGVLDSGRSDVDYTPFDSHDLDAKMLELLRRY